MRETTVTGHTGFTCELWRSIENLYTGILDHPFLRGLTDGTLPRKSFLYYVLQDALYLKEYARALSLVGVRSSDEDTLVMFDEHAAGAIAVERSLHEDFLKDLGVSREEAEGTRKSPTTLAYTSYLLKTASLGEYPEALGAVLPCYWIYEQVGKAFLETGSPDPLYERWLQTYGGEELGNLVKAVLALTEEVCKDLNPSQRDRVADAFATASRYEWMFWDAAWRLEDWPVG